MKTLHTDNMADRDAKGRGKFAIGEDANGAKLTEEDVREIRCRYVPGRVGYKVLAKQFGVSPSNIYMIVNHKIWRHVK